MRFIILLFYAPLLFAMHSESSYPYISGYTWWHFCDWKLTHPDFGKNTYERFNPEEVKLGDTIFVEYDCLEAFARTYLPQIRDKVILITANYGYHGDMPIPGPFAFLLDDEKVAAWFVQNIDRAPTEKLIPMPIGLASNYHPHGNTMLIDSMVPTALKERERPILMYLNFSLSPERDLCVNHFSLLNVKLEPRKSYAAYLRDLTKSIFVISPPGGGIDCHRTWEALLFGCYPVLKSTTLDPLFDDLPVVIVQDWAEVTPEFLQERYRELRSRTWSRDKLYSPYWFQKVHEIQERIRNTLRG
jgi:hypothetical protein